MIKLRGLPMPISRYCMNQPIVALTVCQNSFLSLCDAFKTADFSEISTTRVASQVGPNASGIFAENFCKCESLSAGGSSVQPRSRLYSVYKVCLENNRIMLAVTHPIGLSLRA